MIKMQYDLVIKTLDWIQFPMLSQTPCVILQKHSVVWQEETWKSHLANTPALQDNVGLDHPWQMYA